MIKQSIIFMSIALGLLFICGCGESGTKAASLTEPSDRLLLSAAAGPEQNSSLAPSRPSAVASAIEMSKKYADLSEQMSLLKDKYQSLQDENKQLKDELVPCKTELAQAKKELGEANDLLIEMRVELNNWKDNVIGFRDELRQADAAQLEALLKILTILGGRSEQASAGPDSSDTVAKSN